MEETHLARAKKKSLKERRTLVFVDESGLSERPRVVHTWAPKGQTPQLVFSHAWGKLSVIAGITWWEFYFRLFRGSIKSRQAVEFLGHLRRQIRGRLLIIWEGLAVHRSRHVRDYGARSGGADRPGAVASLRARTQPLRIHRGPSQAPCLGELLSEGPSALEPGSAAATPAQPTAHPIDPRLLATGRAFFVTKCYPFVRGSIISYRERRC